MGKFTYNFSHQFDAGLSGPARSYWIVEGPHMDSHLPPICLHHPNDMNVEGTMQSICHALNVAFSAGEKAKAAAICDELGVPRP